MDVLLDNIGLLATPEGVTAARGQDQGKITLIENAAIGIDGDTIAYAGPANPSLKASQRIDCRKRLVTPGLVDAHTHLVFGGWRHKEMARKLAGASYLEILQSGGGILDTVRQTRLASEEELTEKGMQLLDTMLHYGTTTAECKSGYGLDPACELKQLRVIKNLHERSTVSLAATFMGAHAIPEEYKDKRKAYIDLVCDEMMPAVRKQNLAEFCDIFCETAVFTPDESRYILGKAREHGFRLKAHVDEIDPIAGAEMAAELGCLSAEHLIKASDAGIEALAARNVIACLLPATSFCLDKGYARARQMVQKGVAVAVCTDFNPGSSPNLNLQFAMYLACQKYKLTPAETLTAATLNAAAAIDRSARIGSIELGKQADLVVWDAPDLDYILYRYGDNLVHSVIKNSNVVVEKRKN